MQHTFSDSRHDPHQVAGYWVLKAYFVDALSPIVCILLPVCMYVCTYVCRYATVCMCVSIYICMSYVHTYIHTYIHTHIHYMITHPEVSVSTCMMEASEDRTLCSPETPIIL